METLDKEAHGCRNAFRHIFLVQRRGRLWQERSQLQEPKVIVIDSGHGGIDPGVWELTGWKKEGST